MAAGRRAARVVVQVVLRIGMVVAVSLAAGSAGRVAVAAVLVALVVLVLPGRAQGWSPSASTPSSVARTGTGRGLEVDDVASTMVLLAVALRSGCGVVEAVEAVARVSDERVGADLRSVAAAVRWGVDPVQAWVAVDPGWEPVARVLAVAIRSGTPPSAMLLEAARDERSAELAALDVAGARLGVRLVLPLGVAFLPAFCLTTVVPLVLALAAQVMG